MSLTERTRPPDHGIDTSGEEEEVVRERLKSADDEKAVLWLEAKRRILAQPVPR